MMKYFSFFLFIFFSFSLQAQFKVSGLVTDSDQQPLSFASVVLLNQTDSTVVTYGLTNGNGEYQLDIEKNGKYLMQYTFLGYAAVIIPLKTDWLEKKIELAPVRMKETGIQLDEVEIAADRIPMKMKGDTLVYDAKAFKTKEGDDAEALLEKLPGIQVDKDGKITAQGKEVKKILVNGKEFFSNDPKIATKNLDAKAIEKVEVLDKKSKNAEFTGVDDGEEEKTLNLILKEEYSKGSFGEVYAAGGTDGTYKGKLNYNHFNKKDQTSIIANGNNLNEQGFSFSEFRDFNPSGGYNSNIINGIGSDEGINNGVSAGANLNHEFNKKLEVKGNYFFIQNKNKLQKDISSNNFTPTETFQKEEEIKKTDQQQTHSFTAGLEWKPDSMTQFNFDGNFYLADQDFTNMSNTTFVTDSAQENLTSNQLSSGIDKWSSNLEFDYKRKFEKKGRSMNVRYNFSNGVEQTINDLYNIVQNTALNQYQLFDQEFSNHDARLAYTEPIAKNWYLTASYGIKQNENSPDRAFFNRMNGNRILDTALSGEFDRKTFENVGNLSIKRSTKKMTLGMGSSASAINLEANSIQRDFQYLNPYLWVRFKLKGSQNLRFSYNSNYNLPTLNQLISIPENVNPNQNYIGNPDLKPEYSHALYVYYFMFDPIKSTSYYFYLNYTKTLDKIINQTTVQPDFTTEISPVNTDLSDAYSIYGSFSQPIKKLNVKFQLYTNNGYTVFNSFLNGEPTLSISQRYAVGGSISRNKSENWDLKIGGTIAYNYQSYEINPDFNRKFNNYDWYASGEVSITKTLELTTKYTVRQYAAVSFAKAQTLHFVDASLRQSFKGDLWAVSLIAHDILNQNKGISRSGDVNSISEAIYNSRAQYFMLAVSRKFGKRREDDNKRQRRWH